MFARAAPLLLLAAQLCRPEYQYFYANPLSRSVAGLAARIYTEIAAGSGGNLALSPYTIHTQLSLLYYGARGSTAQQLRRGVIGFNAFLNQLWFSVKSKE